MKFSIVIPVLNNFKFTVECIQSVFDNTKDFQLIIVDNGSTDETPAYLQSLVGRHTNVLIATFKKNAGFAKACNTGLSKATGDYVIFLNNDTVVTPDWAEQMTQAIPLAEEEWDCAPIGIVGPRTNYAGGSQAIRVDPYDMEQLPKASIEHHKAHKGKTTIAGFISGLCMMITRAAIKDIGPFNEIFVVGGCEDAEFCVRAQHKGWKLCIDNSTFIHHYGGETIKRLKENYAPIHQSNRLRFLELYYDDKPKKLVVCYRVRNQADMLKKSLFRTSQFADEIIVLCDRCTDGTADVAASFSKVTEVIHLPPKTKPESIKIHKYMKGLPHAKTESWDLYRDRFILMNAAKAHGADWIMALDADEILEDSFTHKYVHQLMNPMDPTVLSYSFKFCTFFLGQTHYRTDGVFGRMRGLRMWRSLPNQHPRLIRRKRRCSLHCPTLSPFNTHNLRTRIKHYGYESPELCRKKYDFYTQLDPKPDKGYIGPEGYKHLISSTILTNEWKEKNDLALTMVVKNEEINLFGFLDRYHLYFDQIVIVDTGSKDHTKMIAESFGAEIYDLHWHGDFSEAKNFAKSKVKTTWILHMDPDEEIGTADFPPLFKMIEEDVDAWLFQFSNFQKDGSIFYSDMTRLFKNIPQVYWSNMVHENISTAARKHHLTVASAPFKLRHFGYLKDEVFLKRKKIQYALILKRQMRDDPKGHIAYFHYAFHLFRDGHEAKGMKYLLKALDLKPDFFLASKELGLKYLTMANKYLGKTAKIIPKEHYFHQWAQEVNEAVREALNLSPR